MKEASSLKKYLQKNDCFAKDLVVALHGMDIKSEADLSKLADNEQFDELYRQIRVSRAKELKDQSARLRMERLMTKFEKVWRQNTGIQPRGSQTDQTTESRAGKSAERESAMSGGGGAALREWMKENRVWEKTLYEALSKEEIVSAEEVGSLSQTKFDDIVRVVRVQKFSELKDQKARQRVDKLLVHFEKIWRAMAASKGTAAHSAEQKESGDGGSGTMWHGDECSGCR